jgi:hypothetical protein
MFKKLWEYLRTHGVILMVGGFIIALGGLLTYYQTRIYGNATPQIAFGITVAGFVIYVAGRVLVATQRKRDRRTSDTNM